MRLPVVQIPKLIGSDAEFANYIRGRSGDTCAAAVRLLLEAIPGVPARSFSWVNAGYREIATDMGRRYVHNGGCFYNDLQHCEAPTPEVLSASEYIHYWRAVLLRLQQAADSVNRELPEGERLCVAAGNSDGHSNSWASHLNILMSRRSFDELFQKPLHFLWLASFLVSSQIYAGAGKVGSENGTPPCKYQLSQRGGDFFRVLMSWDTTHRRGLINQRDEPHTHSAMARLHCIYYDSNLADFATYLKVGSLQLITAMLETGSMDSSVLIEDPVAAAQSISHSMGRTPVATLHGKRATALDLQYRFADAAAGFVKEGRADGVVPEAETIVDRWTTTLDLLRRGDIEKLSRRLDWAAKLRLISGAVTAGRCGWDGERAKMLDLAYAGLDEEEGLFLALERGNQVDRLTDPERVAACLDQPPDDTRAYTRSRLLELGASNIIEVDWDSIRFLVFDRSRSTLVVRGFDMSDPLFWSRQNTQDVLDQATGLQDALNRLEQLRQDDRPTHSLETEYGQSTHSSRSAE
jgi:proteasome accessory factor A